MPLFHFSENPNIEKFVPRTPLRHPEAEPMVWAIDAWHSPLYFFPSNCPRVCFWPLPTTTEEDHQRFCPDNATRMVVAIESRWRDELASARIYRYEFDEADFVDCQDHGVFVSRSTAVPLSVAPIGPCFDALEAASVEVRLCPSLVSLAHQIMQTSLHWSLIRMNFAKGWEGAKGTPTAPR